MAEYIEKWQAVSNLMDAGLRDPQKAIDAIQFMDSADMRPVVLCKDCVHRGDGEEVDDSCWCYETYPLIGSWDWRSERVSKPRAKWWGYVRRVLYEYPRMRAQLDELQAGATSTTAGYGAVAAHSAPGRPVERAAIVTLPATEQRELEAVEAAVRETRQLRDGESRVRIIDMVFWRRSHTLAGAAMREHMSYMSARRRQEAFIRLVGKNMGLK